MLTYLLTENAEGGGWTSYIWIIVLLVLLVAFFVWSFLSQRKKQKAYAEQINAVKPGCKIKTIGGIVGEVVEVNDADGTFVLKTGGSEGNYSYMRFDKQAIYQTDAKPEPKPETEEEAPAADSAEEPFAEEAKAEEPAQEQEAAEKTEEPEEKEEK